MHHPPRSHALSRLVAVVAILSGVVLLQVPSTAAAADLPLNVSVSFEASNIPGQYVRHRSFLGELTGVLTGQDAADASFILRPALNGTAGAVSFEAVSASGHYLRHQGYRIRLSHDDGTTVFRQDASFLVRPGLSGARNTVSFEAVNYAGHFIRHQNFELWLANKDAGNTAQFPRDVSFRQVHIAALEVGQSRWAPGLKEFDTIFSDCDASVIRDQSRGRVGWGQIEDCFALVEQLAIRFNAALLDRIPTKTIERAVLIYDEAPTCLDPPTQEAPAGSLIGGPYTCWQSGRGMPEDKPNGCVVVRIPSVDWTPGSLGSLLPYIAHPSGHPTVTRLSTRAWDVTEPFRWQTDPRTVPLQSSGPPLQQGFGFLLSGGPSLDQLTGDDFTFCLSQLTNIRLLVTYTVPPDGADTQPR